jgi:hypothetical protein
MRLRPAQSEAFGPEPCAECAAARAKLESAAGGKSVAVVDEKKPSWIGIELRRDTGEPAAGHRYEIDLPDGSRLSGQLDQRGKVRIEGIDPGKCTIRFPD